MRKKEDLNLKAIANEVSTALLSINPKTGEYYTDKQVDAALYNAYPQLAGKDSFDKNGNWVEGASYKAFLLEMARKTSPRGTQKYFQNIGRDFLKVATFGQAKKVAALLHSYQSGIPYDNILKQFTQEEKKHSELYPMESFGGEIAGAFTPVPMGAGNFLIKAIERIPIVGKLLKPRTGEPLVNTAKETAKVVPASMAESVAYTAGTSESMPEFQQRVVPEMVGTGVGSAVLNPVMTAAGAGGRKALQLGSKKFKMSKPQGVSAADNEAGLSVLAQQMDEAGMSPEQITRELERIKSIDPELSGEKLMMDVFGRPFTTATMATLAKGGRGQSSGIDNLEPWFRNQRDRLKKATSRILTKFESVSAFRKKVEGKRKAFGNAYNKLWFKDKEKTRRMDSLSENLSLKTEDGEAFSFKTVLDSTIPSVQMALNNARKLAAEKRTILKEPEVSGGQILNQRGKPFPVTKAAQEYDPEYLHFLKMGYDDALSKFGEDGLSGAMRAEAVQNQRRLIKLMEEYIPGYSKARENYAEPVTESRAFNEGFNILKNSQQVDKVPEMIEMNIADYKGHELEAFKMGASRYLEHFIDAGMNPRSRADKAGKLSQFTLVEKIKQVFGEDTGNKFEKYMNQHSEMMAKRDLVSPHRGSLTQPREESTKLYDFSGESSSMPLSAREAMTSLRGQDSEALQQMSEGARTSNVGRLTLPNQITQTTSDIEAWKRLQRLKEAGGRLRRGAVPSLLSSQSQNINERL